MYWIYDVLGLSCTSSPCGTVPPWRPFLRKLTDYPTGSDLRYEGHRPKQTRRRDHGRPSPPHARHPGNVQDATAPMPTKSGRSVRHMKGGLSEAYSYPSLAQPLLALPHCRSNRLRLKPGPPGFFGAHERRGRAHSGGVATRGTILRGHLTTGASWHGPGCSRCRVNELPDPPERARYRY